jgi:hypothetical protein
MSFAVSAFAFAAAGVGLLINQWMSGWMAVGGMAGLGLFYLAIGVLNLGSSHSAFLEDGELNQTSAHRLSEATNVDLATERTHETTVGGRAESLYKART